MTIRCYGDFDEDVGWLEVFGDIDLVDFVRFVEFHHLDGFHLLWDFFDTHFDCCLDVNELLC